MKTFRVFKYLEELDAFVIENEFDKIADFLGIKEWHGAVWIGRFFSLDSDFGEHWMDNWEHRDQKESLLRESGYDFHLDELFVIDPERFRLKNNSDSANHSDLHIKSFWTDVLKSFEISLSVMIMEARNNKQCIEQRGLMDDDSVVYLKDLESRISLLEEEFSR